MLNKVWGAFFFIAFAVGITKSVFFGDWGIWAAMVSAAFDLSKTGFEIALGLTGIMCLWLGIMRLGEKGGAVDLMARAFGPLLRRDYTVLGYHVNLAQRLQSLGGAAQALGLFLQFLLHGSIQALAEILLAQPQSAQAVDRGGKLVDDFRIEKERRMIHVLKVTASAVDAEGTDEEHRQNWLSGWREGRSDQWDGLTGVSGVHKIRVS